MKKFLILSVLIFMCIISIFAQESVLDDGSEVEPGSSSCTSMGPDNNGNCTRYWSTGGYSYTCIAADSGCKNCVK